MTSRNYSSFLLRFWLTNSTGDTPETASSPNRIVLQVQHLQTGLTWRLSSLQELNTLLDRALLEGLDLTVLSETQTRENHPVLSSEVDSEVE